MNHSTGAATQICSAQFDRRFVSFPPAVQAAIQKRIDELGLNLRGFPHYRMQGVDAFRLRAGDYRIVCRFDAAKNVLYPVAVGNRRDVYRQPLN